MRGSLAMFCTLSYCTAIFVGNTEYFELFLGAFSKTCRIFRRAFLFYPIVLEKGQYPFSTITIAPAANQALNNFSQFGGWESVESSE